MSAKTKVSFVLYLSLCITLSAIIGFGVESLVLGNTLAAALFALAIAAPVLFHVPGTVLGSGVLLSGLVSLVIISGEFSSQFYWLVIGCMAAALLAVVLLGVLDHRRTKALLHVEHAQNQLEVANQNLESKVKARTSELVQANEAKTIFLANVSHEFRTPLNHIIGFTELVLNQDDGRLSAEQIEYLNDVLNSGSHLLALISEVLDISAVESGEFQLEFTQARPRDIIDHALKMVADQAAKHEVVISTLDLGSPECITVDEMRIKQVLINLLTNAIKFSNSGSEVEVRSSSVELERANWHVSVADRGVGIDKKDLDKIFDPFIRTNTPALDGSRNTGLGLALCRKIIELHSGSLSVQSEGKDKGSIFTFEVPGI